MANDVLLAEYHAAITGGVQAGNYGNASTLETEILRRMDSDACRVDILPDGHRA